MSLDVLNALPFFFFFFLFCYLHWIGFAQRLSLALGTTKLSHRTHRTLRRGVFIQYGLSALLSLSVDLWTIIDLENNRPFRYPSVWFWHYITVHKNNYASHFDKV